MPVQREQEIRFAKNADFVPLSREKPFTPADASRLYNRLCEEIPDRKIRTSVHLGSMQKNGTGDLYATIERVTYEVAPKGEVAT